MAPGNDEHFGHNLAQAQQIKQERDKVYLYSSLQETSVRLLSLANLDVQPNLLIPNMLDHAVEQLLLEQFSANRSQQK
jgi:hypothetical protein